MFQVVEAIERYVGSVRKVNQTHYRARRRVLAGCVLIVCVSGCGSDSSPSPTTDASIDVTDREDGIAVPPTSDAGMDASDAGDGAGAGGGARRRDR